MQFLTDTKIDFMKYRKVFVWVSLALLIVSIVELFAFRGLNLGIDFAGGTQMTVRLRDAVTVDDLRSMLGQAGLNDLQIQRYGDEGDNEVLIKVPVAGESEEGSSAAMIASLNQALNGGSSDFDLNQRGRDAITDLLYHNDPDGMGGDLETLGQDNPARQHYAATADAILAARDRTGLLNSIEQLAGVEGVSDAVRTTLEEKTNLGAFHILSTENVGPQIGSELRRKGVLAVVISLVCMLAYIWFRFELRFGVGALVAVFHDFLITLGLFALLNFEFNLSTIAAFLTLVGYSVNDTVVIFDRVRENMRRFRRLELKDIMNLSVNQTLSRTLLTSGTTLLVVSCLFVLGGDVIRGFAFVLLVGVIIGTYSSVFVASPFALLWEQFFGHEAKEKKKNRGAHPSTRTAES